MQRIAVVTGASSGIGAAIARALARRDWSCVLLARREERLRELAAELGAAYEVCDVTDRTALEAVAARHPQVSLLVNNAGIPGRAGFLAADPEQIERVLRTNYLGAVWCLRAFLPALEAAAPADVVNVVSVAGTVTLPASGPYAADYARLQQQRQPKRDRPYTPNLHSKRLSGIRGKAPSHSATAATMPTALAARAAGPLTD